MGAWDYAGRQAARFALALVGAFLLAAAIAALSEHGATTGHYPQDVFRHIDRIAHLQFGVSAITSEPAVSEIARGLPVTLVLTGAGLLVALVVGIPVGLLFGTWRAFRPLAPLVQVVTAIPVFCAGLIALWLVHRFGLNADFATGDAYAKASDWPSAARALAIPALITGTSAAATLQLALQRAVLAATREPFYGTLKRLGLSAFEIDRAYLAPYVLIAFFNSFAEIALSLFAADAVVERLFAWPGAADLFMRSVALQDWNVAALVLLVFAAIVLAADFVGRLAARAISGAVP